MATRTDLLGTRPVGSIEPLVPLRPIGDPHQETAGRLTQIALGRQFQAQVLSDLGGNTFMVDLASVVARVKLPENTKVGDQLPMTMLAHQPRPTLLLGAKPAADETNLSDTAKILSTILQITDANPSAKALTPSQPLLQAAPVSDGETIKLSIALQDSIESSGLFFESHLQEWVDGKRPLSSLMREPQAQTARAMAPLAAALGGLARLLSQVNTGDNKGKTLVEVLQNPQFLATAAAVLQEVHLAQPVLARLFMQFRDGHDTTLSAEPATSAADDNLPTKASPTFANATSSNAPAQIDPVIDFDTALATMTRRISQNAAAPLSTSVQNMAQVVAEHPALARLLFFLGAPTQAALPHKEALNLPLVLALFEQAAQETKGQQHGLQTLFGHENVSLRQQQAKQANITPTGQMTVSETEPSLLASTDADVIIPSHTQSAIGPESAEQISKQLNVLETREIRWQGQIWPGQMMSWEVAEDQSNQAKVSPGANKTWKSTLHVDLPNLGMVTAIVTVSGDHVAFNISAQDQSRADLMQFHVAELTQSLAAAGTKLDFLQVKSRDKK